MGNVYLELRLEKVRRVFRVGGEQSPKQQQCVPVAALYAA